MSTDLQKNRSPNSPRITIEDALVTVALLYQKAGRSPLKRESAAKALGYSGLTGSSLTMLGALNQYGLINQSKGDIEVSELSLQILHPIDAKSKADAIRKAVLSPRVFAEINEKWHELAEDVLSNQLIHNKFTPESAAKTAAVYKANCELANLAKADSNLPSPTPAPVVQPSVQPEIQAPKMASNVSGISFGGELPIPLGNGHVARVPFPMTEEDFNLFVGTLNLWKKKLVYVPDPFMQSVQDAINGRPDRTTS